MYILLLSSFFLSLQNVVDHHFRRYRFRASLRLRRGAGRRNDHFVTYYYYYYYYYY